MTLTEFLLARIAEDEEIALAARLNNGRWRQTGEFARETSVSRDYGPDVVPMRVGSLAWDENAHIARHDPARVLAECEAKRLLIERVGNPDWAGFRFLSLPHADHPDYRAEWRP